MKTITTLSCLLIAGILTGFVWSVKNDSTEDSTIAMTAPYPTQPITETTVGLKSWFQNQSEFAIESFSLKLSQAEEKFDKTTEWKYPGESSNAIIHSGEGVDLGIFQLHGSDNSRFTAELTIKASEINTFHKEFQFHSSEPGIAVFYYGDDFDIKADSQLLQELLINH